MRIPALWDVTLCLRVLVLLAVEGEGSTILRNVGNTHLTTRGRIAGHVNRQVLCRVSSAWVPEGR